MKIGRFHLQLLSELAEKLDSGDLTQSQVAREAGIHQSQVSRILNGKAKHYSRNIAKICKYAENLRIPTAVQNAESMRLLNAAILDIWDGSQGHAESLATVIRALGRSQRIYRRGT